MICYIDNVRDTKLKVCSQKQFNAIVESARVRQLIANYRGGNADSKQALPAFIFMGYNPKGTSRKAENLQPTGLMMMDYDHVDEPRNLYGRVLLALPKLQEQFGSELKLALAHITPSGKGLRLVFGNLPSGDLEPLREAVSQAIGATHDAVTKDLSRLSFAPKKSDILWIDPLTLFKEAQDLTPTPLPTGEGSTEPAPTQSSPLPRGGDSGVEHYQCSAPMAGAVLGGGKLRRRSDAATDAKHKGGSDGGGVLGSWPADYQGVPLTDIVTQLIALYGGEPAEGSRNIMVFNLARDLAAITDRNADWLKQIIPTFGLPEAEWAATIDAQAKKSQSYGMSRRLRTAIANARAKQGVASAEDDALTGDGMPPLPDRLPRLLEHLTKNVMPYQRPAMALAVFPSLAAHVTGSFRFADNKDYELSQFCAIIAPQSVGKGCVNDCIREIMADIEAEDNINRERERIWAEGQRNKKANEKGEPRPDDLVIRWLDSDTTNAAFLMRLDAAERGYAGKGLKNLCTYTCVDEIEELYNFCGTGDKLRIMQMIKRGWDRTRIGAERATAQAVNVKTRLAWNWNASTTITGGRKFFDRALTDGTISRVDLCTIIQPDPLPLLRYGLYDDDFRRTLRPYIERLAAFQNEQDAFGRDIPATFKEVSELEQRMDEHIKEQFEETGDQAWISYAWRTKVSVMKKIIVLYLANGLTWEREFDTFADWAFRYLMWCKLNLFKKQADELFRDERINHYVPFNSPLALMPAKFTIEQFTEAVLRLGCRREPDRLLSVYLSRGKIEKVSETIYQKK